MAQVSKKTVDYYPHDCDKGKKISYIERKFGNNGYAVWHKLLELLGNAKNHFLDLSEDLHLLYVVDYCNVDEKLLIQIIKELVRIKEFDKQLWEKKKVLWNQHFVDSIQDAYKRRLERCITFKEICTTFKIKCNNEEENDTQSKQTKENYIKLYKRILQYFNNKYIPTSSKQEEDWIDCIRLLIERDKFTEPEIENIIAWASDNDFWSKNFLSLLKLRNRNKNGIKYIDVFNEQMKDKNNTEIGNRINHDTDY